MVLSCRVSSRGADDVAIAIMDACMSFAFHLDLVVDTNTPSVSPSCPDNGTKLAKASHDGEWPLGNSTKAGAAEVFEQRRVRRRRVYATLCGSLSIQCGRKC